MTEMDAAEMARKIEEQDLLLQEQKEKMATIVEMQEKAAASQKATQEAIRINEKKIQLPSSNRQEIKGALNS